MGKKLDALLLLGRKQRKTPKLKALATLTISRIAILKNQRHVRCSHALSDVLQLLRLCHHDRALLRVERVIIEQNMVDAFVMIENYCQLLTERIHLLQNDRECPEELIEAVSSLIFAASRCGELPELQGIRVIFSSRYGKEFAARAVELRNNCEVNPTMVQKLLRRQVSLGSRQKLLKQIASDNGITLQLVDDVYSTNGEKQDINQEERQLPPKEVGKLNDPELGVDTHNFAEEKTWQEKFSESMKVRKRYTDVAAAAQEAFESAAYAAAAARAAVELCRSESWDEDADNHNSSQL